MTKFNTLWQSAGPSKAAFILIPLLTLALACLCVLAASAALLMVPLIVALLPVTIPVAYWVKSKEYTSKGTIYGAGRLDEQGNFVPCAPTDLPNRIRRGRS